jgi:hypothetical protein
MLLPPLDPLASLSPSLPVLSDAESESVPPESAPAPPASPAARSLRAARLALRLARLRVSLCARLRLALASRFRVRSSSPRRFRTCDPETPSCRYDRDPRGALPAVAALCATIQGKGCGEKEKERKKEEKKKKKRAKKKKRHFFGVFWGVGFTNIFFIAVSMARPARAESVTPPRRRAGSIF